MNTSRNMRARSLPLKTRSIATKDRLSEIERAFQDKREELISKLLDRVSQVDPQPHKNLQKMSA